MQAFVKAVQRQLEDVFQTGAAMRGSRVPGIQRGFDARLVAQAMHQRQQPLGQVGGEVLAVAFSP